MNDIVKADQNTSLALDVGAMESLNKLATVMAQGVSTVPKHLQENPADCLAVCMQAHQWGMNPYAVAQKTHLVNGALGYEAQLVNAVISSSRAITGRFHYETISDKKGDACVRVGAVINGDDFITWGQPVYEKLQTVKNSPLWKTDPVQQLCYLAVKKWARLHTPDVILGVYTADELEPRQEKVINSESKTFNEINNDVVDLETGEVITDGELFAVYQEKLDKCQTLNELKAVFKEGWEVFKNNDVMRNDLKIAYDELKQNIPVEADNG